MKRQAGGAIERKVGAESGWAVGALDILRDGGYRQDYAYLKCGKKSRCLI